VKVGLATGVDVGADAVGVGGCSVHVGLGEGEGDGVASGPVVSQRAWRTLRRVSRPDPRDAGRRAVEGDDLGRPSAASAKTPGARAQSSAARAVTQSESSPSLAAVAGHGLIFIASRACRSFSYGRIDVTS
jgi:hypothetical protein